MKNKGNKKIGRVMKKIWKESRVNILIIILLLGVSVAFLHVLQKSLLNNAQQVGQALSENYSIEEEGNINAYEMLIRMGADSIDRLIKAGAGETELTLWIQGFLESIGDIMGDDVIDPYAIVDGTIIAANPWTGDAEFNISQAGWYQEAMAADGEVIFTDTYQDSIYNRPVITIAARCQDSENVIAFDVFPENFHIDSNSVQLPESSSYFLCDKSGQLLYYETSLDVTEDSLQAFVSNLYVRIQNGEMSDPDAYIIDLNGERRGVYYNEAQNGWMSIITIPYRTILQDLRELAVILVIVFLAFLTFTVAMSIRDYRLSRDVEKTNETVRVLGNSYYAIYRVGVRESTYDMIKASDDVRGLLPKIGDYSQFIKIAGQFIETAAYTDFMESFSIDNIRQLVKKRVRDFGGDFLRRFGNEYRWVSVHMLFDESLSHDNEVVLCFKEVGQEREGQLRQLELLKNSLENAKNSEESQKRFFSSMSHDMRTPLNAIIGLSELAKGQVSHPEKMEEYLEKINFSSRQLLGLINDILEMSRLEQKEITLNSRRFDLNQCVRDAAAVFDHQAQKEGKSYDISIEMTDRMVIGDAFRLTQILNNLLSNAFKFTSPGGHIRLQALQIENQSHGTYQFIVKDDGVGMSQAFLEKIFIPYERETRFGAKNVAGTGLGMAIVKSIVTQMDGEILVESQLHEGSCFTVTIPFVIASDQDSPRAISDAPGQKREDPSFSLEGRKILLAEDNEINMEIATEILEASGVNVVQAWNGQEAVDLFSSSEEYAFDAILMDMQMPEKNGCDAAREIRRMNRKDAGAIPIIAVTANAFAEDVAATTEAGMDAHISKPINFELLCKTLEALVLAYKPQA